MLPRCVLIEIEYSKKDQKDMIKKKDTLQRLNSTERKISQDNTKLYSKKEKAEA